MRAAQFNRYGGPQVIEFNPDAVPLKLKEGQVLVEGHAASLNPIDSAVRAGYMQAMLPLTFPVTVAGDFAGEVKEVGPGVSDLRPGDQVFGFAPVIVGGSGAAADHIASNALMTARKPVGASYAEAAAMPLAGLSAVQALEDYMKVEPGQKVLIHGGAGGVGSFAVQYAKYLGCYVATTVRGPQEEFVRKLGADSVINFELKEFDAIIKDYDAVLDTVGGEVYRKSFSTLKRGGVLASMVQNPPDQELASRFGVRSVAVTTQLNTPALNHLASLVDKGALKSQIDREYPLDQTREAYAHFETDHPKGKVTLGIK
jgi:NADPH:quinone reductase-like Zn-dependent oxidoreductase